MRSYRIACNFLIQSKLVAREGDVGLTLEKNFANYFCKVFRWFTQKPICRLPSQLTTANIMIIIQSQTKIYCIVCEFSNIFISRIVGLSSSFVSCSRVIPTINYADISAMHAVKLDMSYHQERM